MNLPGSDVLLQTTDYLLASARRDDFAHGALDGVPIAERLSQAVMDLARAEGAGAKQFAALADDIIAAWVLRLWFLSLQHEISGWTAFILGREAK